MLLLSRANRIYLQLDIKKRGFSRLVILMCVIKYETVPLNEFLPWNETIFCLR